MIVNLKGGQRYSVQKTYLRLNINRCSFRFSKFRNSLVSGALSVPLKKPLETASCRLGGNRISQVGERESPNPPRLGGKYGRNKKGMAPGTGQKPVPW